MWKQIRVNMEKEELKVMDMNPEHKLLGGRSLIAQLMTEEVDPACDPLSGENKLIVCTGLLAGTSAPTAHRLSFGGKSPLTGGIKESNVGGTAGYFLANHGIKAIVFEGKPEKPGWKILFIDKNGKPALISADDYAGLNTYDVVRKAEEDYGGDISVAAIGRAGEFLYKNSGICVTEMGTQHPCRVAARGGLGGVMGSKGVKAIVIQKAASRYKPAFSDAEAFAAAQKEFAKRAAEICPESTTGKIGTNALIAATAPTGILPYRNFSGDFCPDAAEKLGPAIFLQKLATGGGKNHVPCQPGCPVRCSNTYHDQEGKHVTSAFEYETLALCGPNLDILDMDTIARIDRMCDEMGLDTIETGCTLGVLMEVGKIPWGDDEAVFAALQEMNEGTEFGRIAGEGAERCGKYYGCSRIPTVKGQGISAYDPRNLKGTGVTYAISPMGADHTAGVTIAAGVDGKDKTVQLGLSQKMQFLSAFTDSIFCLFMFLSAGLKHMDLVATMISSMYGAPFGVEDIPKLGIKTILMERAWNEKAGFTQEDDKLPAFFYEEKARSTDSVFDVGYDEMISLYKLS